MLFNILKKLFTLRESRPVDQTDDHGDIVKPFLDHMEDLRWTIFKCLGVLVVCMIGAFYFQTDLMHMLQKPLHIADPTGELASSIRSDKVTDAFMISFKLAFYVGMIIALPFLLYFVADFVLPALTKKEKQVLIPGFMIGVVLFLAGAAVSYFYILPHTLEFFWDYAKKMQLLTLWTWSSYISFFTWLNIGFGLMCEVPLLVLLLAGFGIVNFKFLSATRNYAITIILVLSAIIAPTPDPLTLLILATPIVLMYEACIWIVWMMESRRRKLEREADVKDLLD